MNMATLETIPLAALSDILNVVLPILFMIIYVVQLLAKKNRDQPRPRQPRPLQPNQWQPKPAPLADAIKGAQEGGKVAGGKAVGKPMRLEEAIRIEVDDFLQRVQGKPEQRKEQAQMQGDKRAAPRQSRGPLKRDILEQTGQNRTSPPAKKQQRQLGQLADRYSQPPARTTGKPQSSPPGPTEHPAPDSSIAEHVATHVSAGSRRIGQHAEHLVDKISQTDERVEKRLHQQFDHSVGSLQHEESAIVRETPSGFAHEISQMLSKPDGIRQLIIANEILRRPQL